MKNFIKFIAFTLDNGNILSLLGVIMFADLFVVCLKSMHQFGVTVYNIGFALIAFLCTALFVAIGVFFAVKDFEDTEYRRRMKCLIKSGEWAKI